MLRLSIESPCDAAWSSLEPVREGERACARCRKTVHDFTDVTAARARALIVLFGDADGVCGRIRVDASGHARFRPDPARPEPRLATPLAAAAASALVACSSARPAYEGTPRAAQMVVVESCPLPTVAPSNGPPAPQPVAAAPVGDCDGDAIADDVDACPTERGSNHPDRYKHGCPTVVGGMGGPRVVILQQLFFEAGRAAPKTADRTLIDELAKLFAQRPDIRKVRVGGHAAKGEANSRATSTVRAERVVAELVKRGVSRSRLEAKGYGDERPVASNDESAGRAQNRRVEFEILEIGP